MFQVKHKVWIEWDGQIVLSDGRAALLEAIDELGSLQQAAKQFGMSYRHAWGLIRKIEARVGFKFIQTNVGGKEGGGSHLTGQGREFLQKYRKFRGKWDATVEELFHQVFQDPTS